MARPPFTEDHHGTASTEMWDRIRKAVYSAGVNRHEAMLHLPACHRTNCPGHNNDDVDLVFRMFADAVAESVRIELLCEAITNPDLGPDATDCEALQDRMAGIAGPWSECVHWPRSGWLDDAARAATQLGYWDWVRGNHDLRTRLSRPRAVPPLTVTRDQAAYTAWWDTLSEDVRDGLGELVEDLSVDDSTLVAESLHWLMLGVFQENGAVPWLTVTGLAPRVTVEPVSLDIDPAYDGSSALDGVNVVVYLDATVGKGNLHQKIVVNVDRPHRDLMPASLDDAGIAIGEIIDRAAELIASAMAEHEEFWRAVR